MVNRKLATRDGISILPEPIKHHIISFLNPKEAEKTSTLSKAWLITWQTRPNLHFIETDKTAERKADFINYIDNTLRRYRENRNGIHTLELKFNNFGTASSVHVGRWVQIAVENGVKSLSIWFKDEKALLQGTVFEAKSLQELCLRCCLLKSGLGKSIRCYNLWKLTLHRVVLTKQMLQRIMWTCASIHDLTIVACEGIKNIKLTGLRKLESLVVEFRENQHVEVEGSNLKVFRFANYYDFISFKPASLHKMLQMNGCQKLKLLHLSKVSIKDEFFLDIAEKFPCLECLEIELCTQMQIIKITSCSIKHINLQANSLPIEIQIDAPNINQFEFLGILFIPLVSFADPSGHCTSKISVSSSSLGGFGSSWFSKLNKLLQSLSQTEISLDINVESLVTNTPGIIEDQVRNNATFPLPRVEKLFVRFVTYGRPSTDPAAAYSVINCILWTCRPKTVTGFWYDREALQFYSNVALKALFEVVILRRDEKNSNSQRITRAWQRDLKDAKLEITQRGRIVVEHPEHLDWETVTKVIAATEDSSCFKFVFHLEWEAMESSGP